MPPEGELVGYNGQMAPDGAITDLLQRLRSAAGHLQAVIAMVEVGEPCESVLLQLFAVQATLRGAERALIRCHLEQSVESIRNNPCPETRVQTLSRLSSLYTMLTKTQTYR